MVLIYIKATPVRTVATGKSPLSYLSYAEFAYPNTSS